MAYRALRLLRHVHLALAQTLDQIFRREVDNLDIVSLVEDAVGYRFPHPDSSDPRDDVVQALDMLDIKRRKNIDPSSDDFLDIKIAFGMSAAWRIRMSELVDEHERRAALEDRIKIHLAQEMAPVLDLLSRDDLKAFEKGFGLSPAVGLDDADDYVAPFAAPSLSSQKHFVGLAYPWRSTEKNLEPAAALLFCCGKQCLG